MGEICKFPQATTTATSRYITYLPVKNDLSGMVAVAFVWLAAVSFGVALWGWLFVKLYQGFRALGQFLRATA